MTDQKEKRLSKRLLVSPLSLAFIMVVLATLVMAIIEGQSATFGTGSRASGFNGTFITLSPSADGQVISGFEITPRFWEFAKAKDRYDPSWLASRDAIVEALVTQAGITRVRIEVRSGVENPKDYWTPFTRGQIGYAEVKRHFYEKINDNTSPTGVNPNGFNWASFDYYVETFVLPLRNRLAQNGIPLYVNLCFVDFKWTPLKGTLSLADHPDEYAELMTQAALRLRDKYHLTPDAVEIILEPDNSDAWTGSNIGRGLVALHASLATQGLTHKYIVPSPSKAIRAAGYIDDIMKVKGAAELIDTLAYHRYDGSQVADMALDGIRKRAKALGADTAMLEYVDASPHDFFRDMEYGGASAWQSYAAAYATSTADEAHGAALWRDPAGHVALTSQFRTLGLVQRSIHPGAKAQRVTLSRSDDLALAFHNRDGSDIVAVYSRDGRQFRLLAAKDAQYSLTLSTQRSDVETERLQRDDTGNVTFTVPAGQVAILSTIAKNGR